MSIDVNQKFPDDSVQAVLGSPWWTKVEHKELVRGRLLHAFVPYVGLTPRTLEAEGRKDPTSHDRALFRLTDLRASQAAKAPRLPVAALPNNPGEVYAVFPSKRRPVLVLGTGGGDLPAEVLKLNKGWKTAQALLVAPYYGVDQNGSRGGWHPEFVKRIRRAEYPQYAYDRLPIGGSADESILRLDQVQPIGKHHDSYELTEFVLTDEALELIDEWLVWLVTGTFADDGVLPYLRAEIPKSFPDTAMTAAMGAGINAAEG